MNADLIRAAEARAGQVSQRSHRPRNRRSSDGPTGANRCTFRSDMTLRATDGANTLDFGGYASVYEAGYEMWDAFGPYTEVVSAGAAADSLATPNLDVPLVLQHDSLRRIARTTNGTLFLAEDEHGLSVSAPALDPTDADVAYIAPKLRAGLIDEMSFMFRITAGQWSPDYTEYRINAFDINRGDVAIVGYGANPATAGSGLRESASPNARLRAALDIAIALG